MESVYFETKLTLFGLSIILALSIKNTLAFLGALLLLLSWYFEKIKKAKWDAKGEKFSEIERVIYISHLGLLISNNLRYILRSKIDKNMGKESQNSATKHLELLWSQVKVYCKNIYDAESKLISLPSKKKIEALAENEEELYALMDAIVSETTDEIDKERDLIEKQRKVWSKIYRLCYFVGAFLALFPLFLK